MVETGNSGETYEGHDIREFGGGKGATEAGIWKAWQERGRVGGGEHG